MRILPLIAAATALGGIAAPAAAQSYPQPGYPQQQGYPPQSYPPQAPYPGQQPAPYPGQPGYGYGQQQGYPQGGYGTPQQQGGLGGILGQLFGGNRYAPSDQQAISQCATAAQSQASQQYRPGYGQPYGNAYGYNRQYAGSARVTAITGVERRRNGLRVTGMLNSGTGYGQGGYGQPYGGGYGQQAYAQSDLSFRCSVDGNGRITNLRVGRADRRGY